MSRRRRSRRSLLLAAGLKWLRRWTLLATFYGSICLGVMAVRVDYQRRRVHRKRSYVVVAACSNALFVSLYPLYAAVKWPLLERNFLASPFALLTIAVKQGVFSAIWLALLALRCDRERRFVAMMRQFFALDAAYFDRQPGDPALGLRFDWTLVLKFAATFAQPFRILYGTAATTRCFDWPEALTMIYSCAVNHIPHAVLFHHYHALWSAHKRLAALNGCLERLLAQLNGQQGARVLSNDGQTAQQLWRLAAAELRELAAVHLRVTRIVVHFNSDNRLQLLGILLVHIINLVAYGFYAVIITDGSLDIRQGALEAVAGMTTYVLLCVDLYLFYSECGGITDCHRRAAELAKAFSQFPHASLEFEQESELFSTQLVLHRLTISLSGLLSATMSSSLSMWAFVLRHTLIMVQFDQEQRVRP